MSRTAALRRQHDTASRIAANLVGQIQRFRGDEDAVVISLTIAKLVGVLTIHLAQEDRCLYPSMIASGDEQAASLAKRFATEMGGLAECLMAFASRWTSPRLIASGFTEFRREALAIVEALDNRIRRENEELYPVAEALFSRFGKAA